MSTVRTDENYHLAAFCGAVRLRESPFSPLFLDIVHMLHMLRIYR
jgi:hypothetical protein